MRKWLKTSLAVLLSAALSLGICGLPAGASGSSADTTARAEKLASLHLFRGTGTNPDGTPIYSLDKTPTRLQGLIMLIRLLGREEEALAYQGDSPFTDVSGSGTKYVAYAYNNGITKGTGPSTFTPSADLSASAYMTFLLRALGFQEDRGDFTRERQMEFAASIDMITPESAAPLSALTLNRGDMVDLSYAALTCWMRGNTRTLAQELMRRGVFTEREGQNAGVLWPGTGWTYSYTPYDNSTIDYQERRISTPQGVVSAHVLTVNTANPGVKLKTSLVDGTLGHTAPFSDIVARSGGAAAIINGNFFSADSAGKRPAGHVMAGGELLYGDSGLTSIGITADGALRVGRPSVFVRLKSGSSEWSAYEVNTENQEYDASVLYTPAYGGEVSIRNNGWVLTVDRGVITQYRAAAAGERIEIPAGGYVVYMGGGFVATSYFQTPRIGAQMSREPYLRVADEDGFVLEGVENIVSGAPRLVRKGMKETTLEPSFQEARFTTLSTARTAAGVNRAGKLVLVSTSSATVEQLREVMLALDCVEAVNLDGGASCALYYDGRVIHQPGRNLTVTLQIFVND